jgi:PAS domain S-box-containing protein
MGNVTALRPRNSPEEVIRLMQEELAETNREVMLLTLELEKRVADVEEANRLLRRHRELIDLSSDAVITLDAELVITGWNQGAREMYGWTEAEAIGRPVRELLHSEPAVPGEAIDAILREKLRWSGELLQTHRDGRRLIVDSRQVLLRDGLGFTVGILEVNRDLTEKRALEEQLRQSQKLESIGQLASGVAHDFNNLLSVIAGYAEMVLSELPQDESLRESVEEISMAASRAAGLTRQLLAFSRRQPAEPVHLDLNDVVRGAEKMLRRLLTADINLVLFLEPGNAVVYADRNHIEQVILNLAVNARDAMRRGGTLAIETRRTSVGEESADLIPGAPAGEYLLLSVSDTGSGMSPEIKARIFEPFFTTKEKGKGTGLGLSTVYGIVKQSRGWISVDSEVGLGTTFRILFPLSGKNAGAPQLSETEERLRGSETILVAEDDGAVRRVLCQALQRSGYQVLEAGNGQEALAIATAFSGRIHLLVADVVMPQLGGIELAAQFTRDRPDASVLWISGFSDRPLKTGERVAFVQKPFRNKTILSEVRKLLDRSEGGAKQSPGDSGEA